LQAENLAIFFLKVTSLIADPAILSTQSLIPSKDACTTGRPDLAEPAIMIGTGAAFVPKRVLSRGGIACRRQRNNTVIRAARTPE
jgi:hypothetical protein